MKKIKTHIDIYKIGLSLVLFLFLFASCEIEDLDDPNNPPVALTENATLGEIQNLVTGIESGMRNRLGTYYDGVGMIGREIYRFSASDPRFTTDLLGGGSSTLDNNTFYTTQPFAERYRVIRTANYLIDAINNTTVVLTDQERNSGIGYAQTIIAYQLLMVLNQQYNNGIRVDVSDPDNLGPRLGLTQSLTAIADMLNDAYSKMSSDTGEFIFALSSGFSGFDTPATFSLFNRALAARVALYAGNDPIPFLNNSFFNLMGDLQEGPSHSFSKDGGDQTNPLFFTANSSGEARVVHPSFVSDAEAGDTRLSKALLRTEGSATLDDLTSNYDFWVYDNNEASIPIIRNEELILIYAEARVGTNNSQAVAAIDIIRAEAGLAPYSGALTNAAIMDEIVNQRRYSLFGEGHRWIDMRRLNRLDELPLDRAGDDVWTEFPIPATESN